MTYGDFAIIDMQDAVKLQTIVTDIFSKSGSIRSKLCFDTPKVNLNIGGNTTRPTEVSEEGAPLSTDSAAQKYTRQHTITTQYFRSSLGITRAAIAEAGLDGNKLGSLGEQVKQKIISFRNSEESNILYKIFNNSDIDDFTSLDGQLSHNHQAAVDVVNEVSMDEIEEWKLHMMEHGMVPSGIIAGANAYKAVSIEAGLAPGFSSPLSDEYLKDGKISVVSGLELMYHPFCPSDYMMIYAMPVGAGIPRVAAFRNLLPTEVVTHDPSGGLVNAEVEHYYGVELCALEGVVLIYTGATSWAAPAKSLFRML